ncbi:helix-turn-helix domain-containing protein [Paenibacillus illinoisensis]|uniref:helix-turn-helix domain-containing protein n=1 Tax=Paenibacillus illinoisensis TaxID=59845 RepID=UPI00203D27A7|nr:helix-turn-helix transcriptional regulator [Paenibacillus illinoisensis]MCM3205634.1 helix-turn-helix transcriptional regulator [Paenibacillus illinoisensis]
MIKSNLKQIVDERNIVIRELARAIDYRFESVRLMYHDEMERYPRELLTKLCVYLNVDINELLTLREAE